MIVTTRITFDLSTGKVLEHESYEYFRTYCTLWWWG